MIVSPSAAISHMLAMLIPRMSALMNALHSKDVKNDPIAIVRSAASRLPAVMPRAAWPGLRSRSSDHALAHLAVRSLQAIGGAFAEIGVDRVGIRCDVLGRRLDDLEAAVGLALTDLRLQPGVEVLVVDPDQTFRRDRILDADAAAVVPDRARRHRFDA